MGLPGALFPSPVREDNRFLEELVRGSVTWTADILHEPDVITVDIISWCHNFPLLFLSVKPIIVAPSASLKEEAHICMGDMKMSRCEVCTLHVCWRDSMGGRRKSERIIGGKWSKYIMFCVWNYKSMNEWMNEMFVVRKSPKAMAIPWKLLDFAQVIYHIF